MSEENRLDMLTRRVVETRKAHATATQKVATTKKKKQEAEQALYDELETMKLRTANVEVDIPGIRSIGVQRTETKYADIIDEDALLEWANNAARTEETFRSEVRKGIMNELVRTYLESGWDLPPGVGWYEKKGVKLSIKH